MPYLFDPLDPAVDDDSAAEWLAAVSRYVHAIHVASDVEPTAPLLKALRELALAVADDVDDDDLEAIAEDLLATAHEHYACAVEVRLAQVSSDHVVLLEPAASPLANSAL